MLYDYNKLKEKIDSIFPDIVSIRRELHMNPELSEEEEKTAERIQRELKILDIPFQKDISGHGIIATIDGCNPDFGVGIRADIDALPITENVDVPFKSKNPGVMHACGHDIHTAILLGTARILTEIKPYLPGSVRLIFQPSEETIGGAEGMIKAGCLKNPKISSVIGLHVEPSINAGSVQLIPGVMNAAACEFYVTITGKSCHGAHPDKGIDSLLPACAIITALQSIITRRLDPADTGLITVGNFHSGQKNNIISGETTFSGIIRTLTLENRTFIKNELEQLCISTAQAYGATCKIVFEDSYPSLENNDELFQIMKEECSSALGQDKIDLKSKPSLGADDFAYFCHNSRGLYYNLGTKRENEESTYPIHNENFNPDEQCIKTGILSEVIGVLRILEEESKKW